MPSEAEHLVDYLELNRIRIQSAYRRSYHRGYEARKQGRSRGTRGRGGNKLSWLDGWDAADFELKEKQNVQDVQ